MLLDATAPRGTVGVLDVGTHKIACLIAAGEPDTATGTPAFRLGGLGYQRSRGVKAGVIVDLDEDGRSRFLQMVVDSMPDDATGAEARDPALRNGLGDAGADAVQRVYRLVRARVEHRRQWCGQVRGQVVPGGRYA